ncbi:YheT family hydrolase [Sediminicola sp. 1XM1-17]|uniref:YheT family hydrolase n=1 Tax=Sediminicola sp. 1XM1-17 TaxID=3127702 RepID=UPI0030789B82
MPIVTSKYKPSILFQSGDLATIYAGVLRKIDGIVQQRERISLPDGDFLDLDWSFASKKTNKVVILLHGLEGNAQRPYITGSAKVMNDNGFDVCAVNYRGCSGEANRLFRSYHSGATEDLEAVIDHLISKQIYRSIILKGFSLGGNLALRYLGEKGRDLPNELKAAIAVSVPCDLYSSLKELLKPRNFLYAKRFKKHLIEKLVQKQTLFPKEITNEDISKIKTLKDFDDIYTSRAHGFKDALDYYKKCSCLPLLENINIPTLMINAQNDSFLGPECYPTPEAQKNTALFLEIPKFGGHVGFYAPDNLTYTEKRSTIFLEDVL